MHTKLVSTNLQGEWDFTPPSSPGEAEINVRLPEGNHWTAHPVDAFLSNRCNRIVLRRAISKPWWPRARP